MNGGQTTSYLYDDQNRLATVASAAGTWNDEYELLGNRIATTHDGQRVKYLLDPSGLVNVAAEFDGSANLLARCTHTDLGPVSRFGAIGTRAYYDFDAIGSTATLTGTDGGVLNRYSYLPFGDTHNAVETFSNPFTFVGATA